MQVAYISVSFVETEHFYLVFLSKIVQNKLEGDCKHLFVGLSVDIKLDFSLV